MTDLECKKMAKVLGIKNAYIENDGRVYIKFNSNDHDAWIMIYIDTVLHAMPLRLLKTSAHRVNMKTIFEHLLKQAADGIRSAAVTTDLKNGKLKMISLVNINETLETFLVRYDLKFTKRRKLKRL